MQASTAYVTSLFPSGAVDKQSDIVLVIMISLFHCPYCLHNNLDLVRLSTHGFLSQTWCSLTGLTMSKHWNGQGVNGIIVVGIQCTIMPRLHHLFPAMVGVQGLNKDHFPIARASILKFTWVPQDLPMGWASILKFTWVPPSEVTRCTRVLFYDGPVGLLQQFGFTHPSPNATHIVLLLHACPTRSSQPCVSPHLHHIFLSHFSTREGPMQL